MASRSNQFSREPSLAEHERRDLEDGVPQIHARVSVLEDAVKNLHQDLNRVETSMAQGFSDIQSVLRGSAKTNWGTVISAVMLLLALYAAAIYPLTRDVERLQSNDATQVSATLHLQEQQTEMRVQHAVDGGKVDVQLAVIETKLGLPLGSAPYGR